MKKLLALILFTACGSSSNAVTNDVDAGPDPTTDAGSGGKDTSWYTSGSRIKMRTLNTPDGARQYVGWHDTAFDDDCTFRPASDGSMRCLPNDVAMHVNLYSDAACTSPAVLVYTCNGAPKYIELQTLTAACGGGSTSIFGAVYARGAQLSTIYQKNGSCTSITIGPEFTAYGIGAEVQLSSWQSATVSVDP